MIITKFREIDLLEPPVQEPVHAVQCDSNTRAVAVTLTAGGVAWEPPAGVKVSVAFKKPDGKKGWYNELPDGSSACSVSGNVVTAILAPEVLTAAGKVDAVIVFQDKDLNQLATFGFTILVEPNPAAGNGISNDYYAYSTMEDVSKAVDTMLDSLEGTKADIGQLILQAGEAVSRVEQEAGPAIVCEASGAVIAVADSSDRMLQGLRVFGRTVQNGTPSPDAPVELASVGDSGSVGLTVAGKNLIPYPYHSTSYTNNGIIFTVNDDGSITASGTAAGSAFFNFNITANPLWLPAGTYTCSVLNSTVAGLSMFIYDVDKAIPFIEVATTRTFVLENGANVRMYLRVLDGNTVSGVTVSPQLELSPVATTYEPGKPTQTLTVSTPNGLPGIQVTSGGNCTDASGQRWVCDEVDLKRGVYVQRVLKAVFDGSEDEGWGGYLTKISGSYRHGTKLLNGAIVGCATPQIAHGFCSHYPFIAEGRLGTYDCITGIAVSTAGNVYIYDEDCNGDSLSAALKEKLAGNPITCLFQLVTPIETALSAEELAAYAALHTNKPNTTVYNDAGAHMELAYVADTKLYIDNKFTELAAAIVSNA